MRFNFVYVLLEFDVCSLFLLCFFLVSLVFLFCTITIRIVTCGESTIIILVCACLLLLVDFVIFQSPCCAASWF